MIFLTLQDSGPFKNVTHVRNETSGLLPLGKLRFDDVQEGKNPKCGPYNLASVSETLFTMKPSLGR